MAEKLKKSERERIIFQHLKGVEDPLYEVSQTKYGKWIVKPKQIQLEEEEAINEPEQEEEQVRPSYDRQQARRERRKRNRRAKQDAKKILDALTNLINGNTEEEEDEDRPRAPTLIEQPNIQPVQGVSFRRRRLAF